MFSQWVFLSVLALAVPSFAWAEDAVSDLAKEQSKAEQGDKRGDELFAEFTRLRQAAETGEPQALFDFGAYFYQQQNYASAREWWGKAAAAGMVRAQIQLAMLYRDGDGGPQDKTEAARWFRKAAEQGDAAAQNEMGVLYWRGEGVGRPGPGSNARRPAVAKTPKPIWDGSTWTTRKASIPPLQTRKPPCWTVMPAAGKRPSSGSARLRPREMPVPSSRWARPTGTVPVPG